MLVGPEVTGYMMADSPVADSPVEDSPVEDSPVEDSPDLNNENPIKFHNN